MSLNALNEILAAEQEARIQKDVALAEAKTIAAGAETDGKKILHETEARALQEVNGIKAEAEKKIAAVNTAAEAQIAEKLAKLRKAAAAKTPSALDYIIEQIK